MEFPPIAFFKTRQLLLAIGASLALVAAFESFYTKSFAMPSFDYSWETPVSRFLGPFLGGLCVLVVNSVTPRMEALAVAPIRFFRLATAITLCVIQWIAIYAFRPLANSFILDTPMSGEDVRVLFISTLAFQAIAMISAALFTGLKAWVLPVLAFFAAVGLGFNDDTTPRVHHVLVSHTPTSAAVVIALWLCALGCLAVLRPRTE